MSTESPSAMTTTATGTSTSPMSPRAAIAMLTLRLRAANQEVTDAEREEAAADEHVACDQLRARLEPLLAEHRRELDAALEQARTDAADTIAAAHVTAAMIRSQSPIAELAVPDQHFTTDQPVPPADVQLLSEPSSAAQLPATTVPISIVIDADAFARVFASVFSTILDERMPTGPGTYSGPMYAPMIMPAAAPVKQSFWSHAKHVDVLLLSAAMIIVLVVLAAWLV